MMNLRNDRRLMSRERIRIFKKRLPIYRKNPVIFAREVLQFEPDPWQKKALMDLARHPKVTIKSGQGVGKTGIEAVAALWFLSCYPNARVVATAPTKQQLNDVLWAEIAKWMEKSPLLQTTLKWTKTKVYFVGHEKRWFATARTATKPENMQGFHEDNMLFIVDEASGVADPILEAVLGTLSGPNNKLLMCANPTKKYGTFYDSFHSLRDMFKCHTVNAENVGRASKEHIKSLIDRFGYESNLVRVRVRGLFPNQEDDVFIPLSLLEMAVDLELPELNLSEKGKEENPYIPDRIDLGVDVARFGDDDSVIATKVGRQVRKLWTRHGQDTMKTVGNVMHICNKLREEFPEYDGYIYVKIDDTGVGGGVSDRLEELKAEHNLDWMVIIKVNFAYKAPRKLKKARDYDDIVTWMWSVVRDLLEAEELQLPDDSHLLGEFAARKYFFLSNGKQRIEKKEDLKKRINKSPDRADAVALACMPVIKKKAKGRR